MSAPTRQMKASGLKWLREIPAYWKTERAKWLFNKMQRPTRQEDDVITAFRDGQVTLRKNRRTEGFTESLKEIGYQGIRKGDLVIHAMDAFAGAIGVSDSDGKGSPVYSVCQPTADVNSYYYAHLLREMSRSQFILALAKGIRERSTDFRFSLFADLVLPLPPRAEQDAIVAFLDERLSDIDRYIAAKQRLIELLAEQKAAIINRAVTRGLDPDVEMKESGIEWLGEIPVTWQELPIRYLAQSLQTGPFGSQLHSHDYVSDEIPVINPANMQDGQIVPDTDKTIDHKTAQRLSAYLLQTDDIVFARRGEMGRCALVTHKEEGWLCGTGSLRMRIKSGYFVSHYLLIVLLSHGVAEYLTLYSVGTTMDNLNPSILGRLVLPVPPISEQKEIISFIEAETTLIENSISKANREIELMQELRTALIAEAVTGKLDVRGKNNVVAA